MKQLSLNALSLALCALTLAGTAPVLQAAG